MFHCPLVRLHQYGVRDRNESLSQCLNHGAGDNNRSPRFVIDILRGQAETKTRQGFGDIRHFYSNKWLVRQSLPPQVGRFL
jgi:hypothetical protein